MASDREEIRYRLTPRDQPVNRRVERVTDVPLQLPRITRLMALAIKLDDPAAASPAQLARLGHVCRARA